MSQDPVLLGHHIQPSFPPRIGQYTTPLLFLHLIVGGALGSFKVGSVIDKADMDVLLGTFW